MEEVIFKWVQMVGLPTVIAVVLGIVLYKMGTYLVNAHIKTLSENTTEMKVQTDVLKEIKTALPLVCKANCPVAECENYKPKKKEP